MSITNDVINQPSKPNQATSGQANPSHVRPKPNTAKRLEPKENLGRVFMCVKVVGNFGSEADVGSAWATVHSVTGSMKLPTWPTCTVEGIFPEK